MIDHVVSKPSFIHTKSGNEAGLDDTDNLNQATFTECDRSIAKFCQLQ